LTSGNEKYALLLTVLECYENPSRCPQEKPEAEEPQEEDEQEIKKRIHRCERKLEVKKCSL